MSLVGQQQRAEAKELKQRRQFKSEIMESRFVLVKEGETWLGEYNHHEDLTCAVGVFGPEL